MKTKPKRPHKLRLSAETLRTLSPRALADIVGGAVTRTRTCQTDVAEGC